MAKRTRSSEPARRVFWVNLAFLLLPVCCGSLFFGLALLSDRLHLDADAEMVLWVAAAVIFLLTSWIGWRMIGRIVVTEEGLEEITARGRRVFVWTELRRIRDETEGYGRHQRRRYRVMAQGGRGLSFVEGGVWGAEALASIIEDKIRTHRPPIAGSRNAEDADRVASGAVGLGNLGAGRPRPGRVRRAAKRYAAQSQRAQIVEAVLAAVVVAAALYWIVKRG